MANEMRQQISLLVKLQQTEVEIRKIELVLGEVDRRTAELDAHLKRFTDAVEGGRLRVQELNKSVRSLESELQVSQSQIAKSHEKLRGVKTNKEYQAGLKEIEELGHIGSKMEDQILACMEQIEAANSAIRMDQVKLDAEAGMVRHEKENVRLEADEGQARLAEMAAEADRLSRQIAPEVLTLYRRVKAAKPDGIAIAAVDASICGGCHMNIPPQMYNELHKLDRLKNCPNCERIIFWDYTKDRSE